jgi:Holliday junction resolvasome RuvABC endonuclease subunit
MKLELPTPTGEADFPVRLLTRGQTVLAFDQSLGNIGWALIDNWRQVTNVGRYSSSLDLSGYENMISAVPIVMRYVQAIVDFAKPTFIAREMPALPIGRMRRTESPLLAAAVIECVAREASIPVVAVSMDQARKRILGRTKATKAELGAAVEELFPQAKTMKPMNEHVRDALAIGLIAVTKEAP